ncbi:S9 family peptidase [Aliikangiella coralliicola]|uniref:S9 family peptidase n=1 Tax=Aliikangiella coralliicola TaxID=2592383 RepID=A0A545UBV4_9GAMM|nr:S9 family peptidase [Aliikangiella coralliicola]TQV86946.1 S9 family peptidase [Aliikangiella coralliicola]
MSQQESKHYPPIATKIDHILETHEHQRNDQYYWLRDDSRENPEVINYLQAENTYAKHKLAHTEKLQQTLFDEMTGRLEPNDESVPVFDKGYWYWSKYEDGQDYRIHIRQKGNLEAHHELLIDQNERAKGHEFYQLAALEISPDQKLLATAEDTVSRRQYDIRIKSLSSGEYYPEIIQNTSGEIVWSNDNQTLFYVKKDPVTLLPFQVYRHKIGTPTSDDILVYEEKDDTFYTYIYKTRSEKYIGIGVSSTMNSEEHFLDANDPSSELVCFLPREKDHKYSADHIGENFYFQTDLNALNEKLMYVNEKQIGSKRHWRELIPHQHDTLLQEFELFNDYLVINERVQGIEKLRLRDYQGNILQEIEFDDAAYTIGIGNNPDPASKVIRYFYSSMTTPDSQYEYDPQTRQSKLLKQDKVLGNFDIKAYQSERIMIEARDGKQVPVSLVYRKDKFKKEGKNPLLVYAYGSYGITIDPSFSISRLSLLDRGFVYAIAHIRGGKMLGRQWYEDGKKLTKMNTFTDYIDVTKALTEKGYGDNKKVYAMGGSAGGLLMGAVMNMAPEFYHGVVAAVPFVDVVTTMLDESIPLTTGEYDEWGNPNDKDYYEYMLSYSPYDQVSKQDYPNTLVVTGLHDSQVQYWEPAKWVAKLRAHKTDNNLLILDTDMEVGHGGKSGRYKSFIDQAKQYAFILDLAGISE